MKIPIPSWIIAVCGASLVVISTALGTIWVVDIDEKTEEKSKTISELEVKVQRTWDSHKLADERARIADIFAGLIAQGIPKGINNFIRPRTANFIESAICTMRLSYEEIEICGAQKTEMPVTKIDTNRQESELMDKVAALKSSLIEGDLNAYDKLVTLVNIERKSSAQAINEIRIRINALKNERRQLQSDANNYGILQVSLNLFGLIIVLFKDLPIWRDKIKIDES